MTAKLHYLTKLAECTITRIMPQNLNYHSMAYQYVEMQFIPELHAVALHHVRAYRLYESVLCESVALVNGFY